MVIVLGVSMLVLFLLFGAVATIVRLALASGETPAPWAASNGSTAVFGFVGLGLGHRLDTWLKTPNGILTAAALLGFLAGYLLVTIGYRQLRQRTSGGTPHMTAG